MSSPSLAPVALFCFKRARHLNATLDALERCPEFASSKIYVYADGPRDASDEKGVSEVRQLLSARKRPNMQIFEKPTNFGLANSIIAAVSSITAEHGRVIVVEDDLILQPSALSWLNAGLDAYSDHDQVMQISAYQYRVPEFLHSTVGNFQRFATTWGWATWDRAWRKFDPLASDWRSVCDDLEVKSAFDAGDVYPFSDMLHKQMTGKIDSWGIRWSWAVFRNSGLTLMPPRSLVKNTGLDGSGTHNTLGPLKRFASAPPPFQWQGAIPPELPATVTLSTASELAFRRALKNTNAMRNHKIKKMLAKLGFKRFSAQ